MAPQVAIQAISASGKSYDSSQPSTFPALTPEVQIAYTAVSLSHPDAIRFRYKLQGIDKDWQEVGGERSVAYRSLPPGRYSFVVANTDTRGVWSDKTATTEFDILPTFYQTMLFRLFCVALFIAMLAALYQLRLRQIARQFNMNVEVRVDERTRIARELHDTLLQSFQMLLLRLQTVRDMLPSHPTDAAQHLDHAIGLTAQAVNEGRDAVHVIRSSAVKTNDLPHALSALGEELAGSEANQSLAIFGVQVEGFPRELHPLLRDQVYRIAAEATCNAFRHARAGRIDVEIRYSDHDFRLYVRDDGRGVDPAILIGNGRTGHYGVRGMHERAKLVGGTLEVRSTIDSGTEVELRIPASIGYATANSSRRYPWKPFWKE